MRHVFLEHPDRPDLAGVDEAYYFGPALYVAPVVERGARTRTVDLPAGLYLDWQDQELFEGGQETVLDAPLSKLPLLLRDGYLVPMLDPAIDTLTDEDNFEVVGPADVADVYDVVGLLSVASGQASFALWDGGRLTVTWQGGFQAPDLEQAASEEELIDCAGCWSRQELDGGLSRVRISARAGAVSAGGLELTAEVDRRVRWDLYLVQ